MSVGSGVEVQTGEKWAQTGEKWRHAEAWNKKWIEIGIFFFNIGFMSETPKDQQNMQKINTFGFL